MTKKTPLYISEEILRRFFMVQRANLDAFNQITGLPSMNKEGTVAAPKQNIRPELRDWLSKFSKIRKNPPHSPTNNYNTSYKLGSRSGNTRTIGTDQVLVKTPRTNNNGINSPNGITTPFADTTDGYIGDSKQAKRGDCYLLAEVNAIRNTKNGQELLTKNCKKNKDGSYTVTLPGANKIREEYAKRGLPCEVTGSYTISAEALEKAVLSDAYSKGDLEVVAYELAVEAYRAEMSITVGKNGKNGVKQTDAESNVNYNGFGKNGDVLSGGRTFDAGFLLTGNKSEVFEGSQKRYNRVKPYKDGKYGYITREEMARRTGADISMYENSKDGKVKAGVSEVSHYTQNEQAINSMLSKYEGKEGDYAITFGVRVAQNGPDGTTKAGGGHALNVLKITKDTVYVANPWHPDKIEPIPRSEFVKMTTTLSALPTTEQATKKTPTTKPEKPQKTPKTNRRPQKRKMTQKDIFELLFNKFKSERIKHKNID